MGTVGIAVEATVATGEGGGGSVVTLVPWLDGESLGICVVVVVVVVIVGVVVVVGVTNPLARPIRSSPQASAT